ncbi:endonuclease/exonuclease/phosphatase family protein [Massilia sp. IC2-476]|uniref:endonuclease/exonuclease/phosphatase family protein n=1 Tax=Massilia sp. IC2-476 TaxID=2887199 RepID=UPI001D103A0D|nr:endonuclease/exonuclease/phosphatase family protein [Massilia sp. IC2-476]MCC2973629.1 endonuclease/exonuclease/phosphatase family protein [Massilia sp. IC2-476]
MSTFKPMSFAILAALFAAPAVQAQAAAQQPSPTQFGVASFNMAWAGSQQDFDRQNAVCKTVSWCDTRPRREPGQASITEQANRVARQCAADTERLAGGPAQQAMMAPCNAYQGRGAPVELTSADYAAKLAGLQATIDGLVDKHGVRVLAFQEVRSAEVIKQVLGKHAGRFGVCDAAHEGFQTVAFAWDRSLSAKPAVCSVERGLEVTDNPADPLARKVRPGLALELELPGRRVAFLNVHLKSGCANIVPTPTYQARLLDDRAGACQTLNRQVAPLERWLDSVGKQSPEYVLLGDFNRRIDEEAAAAIKPEQVRTDGSNPAGVPVAGADGKVATRYLWQELNDGSRTLQQVPLSSVEAGCRGFTGLDHIVLSGALAARQPANLGSRKTAVVQLPGQRIETSDHCPRSVTLSF